MRDEDRADLGELEADGILVKGVPYAPSRQPVTVGRRVASWRQLLLDRKPRYAKVFPLTGMRAALPPMREAFRPEVAVLEELFTAPLLRELKDVPAALEELNVEWRVARLAASSEARLVDRLAMRREAGRLRRWEAAWLRAADSCVAVSTDDQRELSALSPGTPVYAVPNGVDVAAFAPPADHQGGRRGLLFFGNLDYRPNVQGLTYFCDAILPRIRESQPEATLTIIGANAGRGVARLASRPGVMLRGFVPDVRPYLWAARASVVPLLAGGGTRFKILEALAAGCPVISTTVGAQGLPLTHGREVLLADDPADFAAAVAELLTDTERWNRVSAAGGEAARDFDWQAIGRLLEGALEATIQRPRPSRN
jgi:glycosyltransferase involved in cell wall biosynthesis